jgi:hypothetical protein
VQRFIGLVKYDLFLNDNLFELLFYFVLKGHFTKNEAVENNSQAPDIDGR